jgi:hypothetical protein
MLKKIVCAAVIVFVGFVNASPNVEGAYEACLG